MDYQETAGGGLIGAPEGEAECQAQVLEVQASLHYVVPLALLLDASLNLRH